MDHDIVPVNFWEIQDSLHRIGIGELAISKNPGDVIVTYALGSCVGLTLYDPVARVGGMVHCKLPDSKMDSQYAGIKPAIFVDSGVPALLDSVLRMGADIKRLQVKMAGASVLESGQDLFRIGERNYSMVNKVLSRLDLRVQAEECGGNVPRTLYLLMKDGRTMIRSQGHVRELK